MRFPIAAFLVSLGLAAAFSACAQSVDSGREFQVNPVSPAGSTLLYPGGQYMRTVPLLRQPGDKGGPVRLHMPAKGVRKAAAPSSQASKVQAAAPRPKMAAAKPKQVASATPAPARSAPGAAGIFGATPSNPFAGATAAPQAPKAQVATAEPNAGIEGLTKRTQILFAATAEEPADTARDAIRFLAGDLMNAMVRPSSRVWLMGHGGAKGDKGSEARRLSLKRALAIRQLLIDAGLSTDRISVQAQGGVDDSGPADRVDVYVKE